MLNGAPDELVYRFPESLPPDDVAVSAGGARIAILLRGAVHLLERKRG
jgi:hypothetical protein